MSQKVKHTPLPMELIKEHLGLCGDSPSGLRWLTARRGCAMGPAGGLHISGRHYQVGLVGTLYLAHRIVFALANGVDPGIFQIDHRNGDGKDNRPENLRLATNSQNGMNRAPQVNNTSGIQGVYRDESRSRWYGQVHKDGRCVATKSFNDIEDARVWITAKRLELFGEFAPENRQGLHRIHPIELLVEAYELNQSGVAWSVIHHRLRPGLRDAVNRAKRDGIQKRAGA